MSVKMTRRGLIAASCLSLAAGVAAQTIVLGGQTGYRDLTIRSTYGIPVTSTGLFTNVARWAESRRGRLWLRNPAGSPGSIRVATKTGSQNKGLDTYSATAQYTLAPGEEIYEENGGLAWLAWSADSTAPADLTLIVEVECLAEPATGATTTIKRAITSSGRKVHSIANATTFSDAGLIGPSKDGTIIYRRKAGATGTLGWASAAAFAADPANVAWTYCDNAAAPHDATGGIVSVVELADGELLLGTLSSGSFGFVRKSSGWATNPKTATFVQVLSLGGTRPDPQYAFHQWTMRGPATVWVSEGGPQTSGGAGNATADAGRATRLWRSDDNGASWVVDFDLRDYATSQGVQYPAGVHLHGFAYDAVQRRLWVCYGDGTGQGDDIAGLANAQVIYREDGGTGWTKLALPLNWKAASSALDSNQYIAAVPLADVVLFTPDESRPLAPFAMRRSNGTSELLGSTDQRGLDGRITRTSGVIVMPGITVGRSAGTYKAKALLSADELNWSEVAVPHTLSASGASGARWGMVAGGKLILQLTGQGAGFVVADLAYS